MCKESQRIPTDEHTREVYAVMDTADHTAEIVLVDVQGREERVPVRMRDCPAKAAA